MKLYFVALLFCLSMFICGTASAYTPPVPTGYITDTTGSLSVSQVAELNSKISDFNKRTQNEIAVLLIKSIGDSNIEDLTQDTFNSWRVGKAGLDNGVLLVIAIESRKMRLQTGKGAEGDITDLQASDILSSMKPGLRSKDYYGAINLATDKTIALLESRHGQKVDPGQGAQFNKPIPETTATVSQAPVAAGCAVGVISSGDTDLTWAAGFVLLFIAGIIFARYRIRRNAYLKMEAIERKVDEELAAEAAARKEAARVILSKKETHLIDEAEKAKFLSHKNVIAETIRQPIKVITPDSHKDKEVNRKAAQATNAVRTQSVVDAAVAGTLVAKSFREIETDVSAARAKREAAARRQEERDADRRIARREEDADNDRRAYAIRQEQEAREEARRVEIRLEEDRRRRQREDDDRQNSYSSSSSNDSSWSGSSDSGFGGGDSGGGGSSDSW